MSKIFLLLCLFIRPIHAEIIEIHSFDQAKGCLSTLNQRDLVLFDVDYTLTIPDDKILRPEGQELLVKLKKEILEAVSKGKYPDGFLLSQVVSKTTPKLVDKGVCPLIYDLQKRGVLTLAFTGFAGSMADWRIEELALQGLDFGQTFPLLGTIEFSKKEKSFLPQSIQKGKCSNYFWKRSSGTRERLFFLMIASSICSL